MRQLVSISVRLALGLSLLLLLFAAPGSAQTITSLPDGPVTPSGRLRIRGIGLGNSGVVRVNGVEAITTVWRQNEVHAYVPEPTNIGSAQVQVTTPNGASNSVPFEVIARQADGRVRWRFAISGVLPPFHGVGVGPDGTVYVDDTEGRLYAIRSDGALAWVYEGNNNVVGGGVEGPIDVAPDGTIYYATNPLGPEIRVHAVNPDGTRKWMYSEFSIAFSLIAGPNLGPDGNLYAVFDRAHLGTRGAFSLDTDGNLRWWNRGTPFINEHGSLGGRIAFGPEAFYVAFDEYNVPGVAGSRLFGFEFDGTQRFAIPWGGWPQTRTDGSMLAKWGISSLIRSLDAFGTELWTLNLGAAMAGPTLGPDGVAYHQVANVGPKLHAIDTDGSLLWTVEGAQMGWMANLDVSPGGEQLLDGGRANLGQPGWIRSYDTLDGSLNWGIDLPEENPGSGLADLVVASEWTFDSDPTHGYVAVVALVWNTDDAYSYVYAMDIGSEGSIGHNYCDPAVINSSGLPGLMSATGGDLVVSNDVTLMASQLPSNALGYFLTSRTQGLILNPGGSSGNLCLGGTIGRYAGFAQNSGPGGTISLQIDLASMPVWPSVAVLPGETWNFTAWFRDGVGSSNFTEGLAITFR